jgi:hypothetical protein
MVIDRLDGDVLGRVLAGFVGMQSKGEPLVVLLDGLLIRRLIVVSIAL